MTTDRLTDECHGYDLDGNPLPSFDAEKFEHFVCILGLAYHPDTDVEEYTDLAPEMRADLDALHAAAAREGVDLYELGLSIWQRKGFI